jgi:hypothetical protein
MDLFDKAEKITMMSLSILYNTNPMTFAICVLPPLGETKQQGLDVKGELHEEDTSIQVRRKKKGNEPICGVVIREVNSRKNNGDLPISRSS